MLLESGRWLGRGSVLAEGQSRGQAVECELRVERDDGGLTLSGRWRGAGDPQREFVARVAGNETGTYTVALRLAGERLQGTAKLDSPPNLGLLWNDTGSVHATFALFAVSRGYGFRGFVRHGGRGRVSHGDGGGRLFTWEVAFTLEQEVAQGDNVVSLHRRRR
jgi:hypothetical protein